MLFRKKSNPKNRKKVKIKMKLPRINGGAITDPTQHNTIPCCFPDTSLGIGYSFCTVSESERLLYQLVFKHNTIIFWFVNKF